MPLSPERIAELDSYYGSQAAKPVTLYMPKTEEDRNAAIADVFDPAPATGMTPERMAQLDTYYAQNSAKTAPKTQENPGFLDEMGANFSNAVQSSKDLLSGNYEDIGRTVSTPKTEALADKLFPAGSDPDVGGYMGLRPLLSAARNISNTAPSDWAGALLEKIGATPEGKVLSTIGGINPVWNAGGTAINRYVNPAISQLTGIHPDNLNLIELGLAPLGIRQGGSALENVGRVIENSGQGRAIKARDAYVQDLVLPKETPTIAAENAKRTTAGGVLRRDVYNPTPQEQAIAETVSTLPVKKGNTLQKNLNIIQDANRAEAESLYTRLKENDAPVDLDAAQQAINRSLEEIRQNPFVSGDGEKAALKIVNFMNKAILDTAVENNGLTASGLLQARKNFDGMIKSQKGGKIFDPNLDSATSIAIQNMRQRVNDLIAETVPSADVKASLRKQSNLYSAEDNIAPKAAKEASTSIGRVKEKISKGVNIKNAVLTGIAVGGPAWLAPSALPLLATGVAAYGAGKALANPRFQTAVGKTIKATGNLTQGSALRNIGESRPLKLTITPKDKMRK